MGPKKQAKKQVQEPVVQQPPPIPPHQLQGYGRFQYSAGAYYQGQWHLFNGIKCKHGKGTLNIPGISSNKIGEQKYEGQWQQDKMSGYGTYYYADGAIYRGNWKNNRHHGQGQYQFPNATIYEGQWENHLLHGTGFFIDSSGKKWAGEFRNGKFDSSKQKQFNQQKQITVKKNKIKQDIMNIFNNVIQALNKSDKKTLKDNMAPYFAAGDKVKQLFKEPYSKLDERPQQKWVQVVNILKTGKILALTKSEQSTIFGAERILSKQLEESGQIAQITAFKDQRSVKAVMGNIDENNWIFLQILDEEKKK